MDGMNKFWVGFNWINCPTNKPSACYLAGKRFHNYVEQLDFLHNPDCIFDEEDFSGERDIIDLFTSRLDDNLWALQGILGELDLILQHGGIDLTIVRVTVIKKLEAFKTSGGINDKV